MGLQQNLYLITLILKLIVRLLYICMEDFILDIKGNQKKKHFSDYWSHDNIALKQRNMHNLHRLCVSILSDLNSSRKSCDPGRISRK